MRSGGLLAATLLSALLAVSPAMAEDATQQEEVTQAKETTQSKETKQEKETKSKKDAKAAKETNLEEIVVTATRTEKSIADAPGSVSVVSKKEMEKRNIHSVDQALTLLPGVISTRNKGLLATTTAVTIRGIPLQGRTLMMMDGMPLNDAYSSGVVYPGINTKDLERIEVVKGPSSSLYGGSAMGGVVNFMTAMPTKREFTLSTGYGDEWHQGEGMADLWTIRGSYGDRIGKMSLYGSFGYRSTKGYPTQPVVVTSSPAGTTGAIPTFNNKGDDRFLIGDTGDNRWWDYSANFRIQYDFSENTNLRFTYLRNAYKYTYDSPHSFLKDAAGNPVFTTGTSALRESTFLTGEGERGQDIYIFSAETLVSDIKGKFTFGILDNGESWYISPTSGNPAPPTNGATREGGFGKLSESASRSYYTDIQLSTPIMQKHVLTGGFSFRYDYADAKETPLSNWMDEESESGPLNYKAGGVSMTYGAYLQGEIALLDSLTFYAGVRDDFWVSTDGYAKKTTTPTFDNNYEGTSRNSVSPKGAVVWRPLEGTTMRISGGKAFRPPTIYQQYRTWATRSGHTTTNTNANPALEPEYVLSWDVGIDQKLWKGGRFKATYFENYIHKMISAVTISDTTVAGERTIEKQQRNVGTADSKGVELEAEQSFGDYLRLFASYTYMDSQVNEYKRTLASDPDITGKCVEDVPRNMFTVGLDANYGPATLFLSGRYVGKRFSDSMNEDRTNNVYMSYDPYFLMDLKASYRVTEFATLSFAVDNLLDRQYYSYYKSPGRSWFASVDFKF